jgi:DNA-binding transcriptional regulator YhcF (GntR family)
MKRIKFSKGYQRKFIQEVIVNVNSPSLRELARRVNVNYSTFKNYFNEERCLSESLFNDLCYISKINKNEFNFEVINEHWGQVKGGKIRRKVNKS